MDQLREPSPLCDKLPRAGQLGPFKVTRDHPPGPFAADLVDRLANEVFIQWSGRFSGAQAREAATLLLAGKGVVVPPPVGLQDREPGSTQACTVILPRWRR